jgi:uncharacterized protein YyaL (SSP411 family)
MPLAEQHPLGFGAALHLASEVARPIRQLVVIVPDADADAPAGSVAGDMLAQAANVPSSITAVATDAAARNFAAAGFELFAGRGAIDGQPTAYLCTNFVCALPTTDPAALT